MATADIEIGCCKSNICFTWNILNGDIVLKCIVHRLELPVSIVDPSGKERAYCLSPIPSPYCFNYYKDANISQDLTQNETRLVLHGELDNRSNGIWLCRHGGLFNEATVEIMLTDNLVQKRQSVTIYGPKYVRTNEHITLTCSSSKSPVHSVDFLVNGKLHSRVNHTDKGCSLLSNQTSYSSHQYRCLAKRHSYTLRYVGEQEGGTMTFGCVMEFQFLGKIGDCIFIDIIDLTGPSIRTTEKFPLTAGTITNITCSVQKHTDTNVILILKCAVFSGNLPCHRRINSTNVLSSVSYPVSSSDNGSVCVCEAILNDITFATSMTFNIQRTPVIVLDSQMPCKTNSSVTLFCRISGELSENFGFAPWLQSFEGIFIREINGITDGIVSSVTISKCSFADSGRYLCQAWNRVENKTLWTKKDIEVVVTGPPIFSDDMVSTGQNMTLSVKYYSITEPSKPKWFVNDMMVSHNKEFVIVTTKTTILVSLYGTFVPYFGYVTNLTISMDSHRIENCYVKVVNEYGNALQIFFIETGQDVSKDKTLNDGELHIGIWISIIIAVFFSTVLISLLCFRGRTCIRANHLIGTIYYAAPLNDNQENVYNIAEPDYVEITELETVNQNYNIHRIESVEKDIQDQDYEEVHEYIDIH